MAEKKCSKNKLANPSWLEKPGVLGYIIDSYQGLELSMVNKSRLRRIFRWEVDGQVYKGNAEAFTLHLGMKFGLTLGPSNACYVHAILRELGEVALPSKKERERRDKNSPNAGKFRQPDPDKWQVR